MKLKGKTAVITGAASGLGKATALKFAGEGIKNLTLVDLNPEGLEVTKLEVLAIEPGIKLLLQSADVAREDDVKAFIEETIEHFGALDILFNNAGIEGFSNPIEDMPFEAFSKTISINLFSVFLGMKYALGYMKQAGGGSIINTSSIGGLVALPNSIDYVATKHAVIGMTKNAAAEYGPYGIRTNAVCPGVVMTGLHKRVVTAQAQQAGEDPQILIERNKQSIPLKRYGEADEIADLVCYLASDESSYVNGVAIAVDGGYTVL
ncbi:MAG: glucose 1-dehydrogenase [Clostridiales Family XIII bacterium]|nr:glucose 1-dehydrogenase [Clostridiales Family XIII bacterium]